MPTKNPITESLPADLPENWSYDQTVYPDGEAAGYDKQHGYNYLMRQVNAAQKAAKEIGEYLARLQIDADQILKTLDIAHGGTGARDAATARFNLGLGSVDNTRDADKTVKKAGTAESVAWSGVQNKPSSFTPSSHTHNYAGSSSAGGSANSAVKLDSSAGSATQPVYFSGGKPVACTYTLGKSVPSNALFTDTNTWRGIVNALTSDSTSESLSAAQGKALKALVDGKAPSSHTHAWDSITSKPSSFTPSSHTHNYAGSSSAGGSASSAVKLDSSAGSATQPVYFSGGKPVACTYTLGKSVPPNALFTDTNTWRGIVNALTSDSTSESLSAAQGKALKALVDGKAPSSHTHAWDSITGKPSIVNKIDVSSESDGRHIVTIYDDTILEFQVPDVEWNRPTPSDSYFNTYNRIRTIQICYGLVSGNKVTFPAPFVDTWYSVVVTPNESTDSDNSCLYVASKSTTGFSIDGGQYHPKAFYIAIGFWI